MIQLDLLRDGAASQKASPIYLKSDKGVFSPADPPAPLAALAAANPSISDAGSVLASEHGAILNIGDNSDPLLAAAACEKLPEADYVLAASLDPREATLFALGWLLGSYQFDRYKSRTARAARLVAPKNADVEAAKRAAAAVALVRDLVNTPAAEMSPAGIEEAARSLAEEFDARISVITGAALLDENFPMVHAVGRAAASPPRLIDVAWGAETAPKVTLVGKGVAFDSGGLNIKGASGMALMKKDMGGCGACVGFGAHDHGGGSQFAPARVGSRRGKRHRGRCVSARRYFVDAQGAKR